MANTIELGIFLDADVQWGDLILRHKVDGEYDMSMTVSRPAEEKLLELLQARKVLREIEDARLAEQRREEARKAYRKERAKVASEVKFVRSETWEKQYHANVPGGYYEITPVWSYWTEGKVLHYTVAFIPVSEDGERGVAIDLGTQTLHRNETSGYLDTHPAEKTFMDAKNTARNHYLARKKELASV